MAFLVDDRVLVTDQSSQWRGKLGTVMIVDTGDNFVRLDGMQANNQTVLAKDDELSLTSFLSPIAY